jgi:hypothetical protein
VFAQNATFCPEYNTRSFRSHLILRFMQYYSLFQTVNSSNSIRCYVDVVLRDGSRAETCSSRKRSHRHQTPIRVLVRREPPQIFKYMRARYEHCMRFSNLCVPPGWLYCYLLGPSSLWPVITFHVLFDRPIFMNRPGVFPPPDP